MNESAEDLMIEEWISGLEDRVVEITLAEQKNFF